MTFALGLIRDVAATEQGQEIINDLRPGGGGKRAPDVAPSEDEIGEWRRHVNQRLAMTDRNVETLARMLNAEHEAAARTEKRQRVWNVALGAGVLIALAIPLLWWLLLAR